MSAAAAQARNRLASLDGRILVFAAILLAVAGIILQVLHDPDSRPLQAASNFTLAAIILISTVNAFGLARARDFNFDEDELETLGTIEIRQNKIQDAIALLDLNAQAYPTASSAWNNLRRCVSRGRRHCDGSRAVPACAVGQPSIVICQNQA